MPTLALVRNGKLAASYPLDAPTVVVGRDDGCDISLAGPLVSREHCRFTVSGDTCVVEDLGSINGTYVNGERVQRQALAEGDRIAIVPHILVYHAKDKEPVASPASAGDDASTDFMATTHVDADEVNRRLSKLLAESKPYGFSITCASVGGDVDLIAVSGPLDAHTADMLEEAFNVRLTDGRCRFIVDMAAVNYIASAGVGVLLSAVSGAEAGGGALVLVNITSEVQEVLDLGFIEMFKIVTDRQEALAFFQS